MRLLSIKTPNGLTVSVRMDDLSTEDAGRVRESMSLIESIVSRRSVYEGGTIVGVLIGVVGLAASMFVGVYSSDPKPTLALAVGSLAAAVFAGVVFKNKEIKSRQQKTDEDVKALVELMHQRSTTVQQSVFCVENNPEGLKALDKLMRPCSACHDFVVDYAENDPDLKAALAKYDPSLETPVTV